MGSGAPHTTVLTTIFLLLLSAWCLGDDTFSSSTSSPYKTCADGRFGIHCEHECSCEPKYTCDSGPVGSGVCYVPKKLPIDLRPDNRFPSALFKPSPVSRALCSPDAFPSFLPPNLIDILTGEIPHPTYSHYYAGHQFQASSPEELGDGRSHWFALDDYLYQSKGTGPTSFSRAGGDGRMTFPAACREFLLHSYVATLAMLPRPNLSLLHYPCLSQSCLRNINYNSSQFQIFRGAVLLERLEPSSAPHYRLGSIVPQEALNAGICAAVHPECECDTTCFVHATVKSLAGATAVWSALGFTHGNLNCDNLRLDGSLLDLNVASFIDAYDPFYSPNMLDEEGIYSFGNQSSAVKFCAARMSETLLASSSVDVEALFDEEFVRVYYSKMRDLTGLPRDGVDSLIHFLQHESGGLNYHTAIHLLAATGSLPGFKWRGETVRPDRALAEGWDEETVTAVCREYKERPLRAEWSRLLRAWGEGAPSSTTYRGGKTATQTTCSIQ